MVVHIHDTQFAIWLLRILMNVAWILTMVHIFSVIYWIWVCISWAIMYVIYCICLMPGYTDIIWVCVSSKYFGVWLVDFFLHWCRPCIVFCVYKVWNWNIWMCFYFLYFSVSILCAKISFSINLSAIMIFFCCCFCLVKMFMSFYINFLNETNSKFTHIHP